MRVISSHQYNTGFSYHASGHNIESADVNGYINPSTVAGETQTLNGVQFSWTSPSLEAVPRWRIVKMLGRAFQFSRVTARGWFGKRHYNKSNYNNNYNHRNNFCLWAIILFLSPVKVSANTTVASPNSSAQGVVNNNATMITPSSLPQNRYSQGIVCTSPSLTITPYLTDAWSFNRPTEYVTRQNIYDEDTGEVKYVQETPRFEKDNYNLKLWNIMQFNIPLGNGGELCKKAAKVNIEAQELLN